MNRCRQNRSRPKAAPTGARLYVTINIAVIDPAMIRNVRAFYPIAFVLIAAGLTDHMQPEFLTYILTAKHFHDDIKALLMIHAADKTNLRKP